MLPALEKGSDSVLLSILSEQFGYFIFKKETLPNENPEDILK